MMHSSRSRALRDRLLARARASREDSSRFVNVRQEDGAWRRIIRGVRAKHLDYAGSRSELVEIDAGITLPMHRHHEHEECLVLRGAVEMGDLRVGQGDYHLAPAGSLHVSVHSPDGALLFLRGAPIRTVPHMLRSVVTAWTRSEGPEPTTIRAHEGAWETAAYGVRTKQLWRAADEHSLLLRLAPEASLPAQLIDRDEEIMVLEGEAFFGDTLLRAGELQFAATGNPPRSISSDVGALLYFHGSRAAERG